MLLVIILILLQTWALYDLLYSENKASGLLLPSKEYPKYVFVLFIILFLPFIYIDCLYSIKYKFQKGQTMITINVLVC